MDNFDFYISSNGYLIIPKYHIEYLVNFNESNIPSMPEATEASVKIAGRDGDIVLGTVYEPMLFEIVCYTPDNLSLEEKIQHERKINSFLNSIKNKTKTFAIEKDEKFYNVKYSGALTTINYPKHIQFTIPLKSSNSFAMSLYETKIIGNETKKSETIEPVGAIFTIRGPALKPIITFNNYKMSYNENILEGNTVIINSKNSTVTHFNSVTGVRTNAMLVYNHEFPKVINGNNTLEVSSGINDPSQIDVSWYDLKL